ncbi:hypothetical protein C2W62_51070 [Candidatus Entotheonella serta]|nr:hypothetical protein C2W62_51070 [Candidatus Entotheonella serta]
MLAKMIKMITRTRRERGAAIIPAHHLEPSHLAVHRGGGKVAHGGTRFGLVTVCFTQKGKRNGKFANGINSALKA